MGVRRTRTPILFPLNFYGIILQKGLDKSNWLLYSNTKDISLLYQDRIKEKYSERRQIT